MITSRLLSKIAMLTIAFVFIMQSANSQPATVTINPTISHAIKGQLNLEREKYFNLSAGGYNFESKINNKSKSDYYYKDLGMNFGRDLGMVYAQNKWGNSLREDPDRPGFMDVNYLKSKLNPGNGNASAAFKNHFSPNIGVAMHDRSGAWPDWVDQFFDPRTDENHKIPNNTDAAAEMAFNILKYGYTDWTRPATYEILNEPHWAYYSNQKYADLHTKVKQLVDTDNLNVEVGGPCLSVGYFYKNNYGSLNSITGFIDNTNCDLDFYSFHVYDYLSWSSPKNDIVGRISTGLPIDGVLDAVNNYTNKKYNKEIQLVFSEHGGYISSNQETTLNNIADTYFPGGSGFDYEMKKRSISNFNLVSSSIANTMAFMNHPHSVKKAVPFILLESFGWDPKYYSSLLVADNFTNKNNWIESPLIYFYKYFSEIEGRRIESYCDDPDLQHHAFAEGNTMYLLFNNQANKDEALDLSMNYPNEIKRIRLRKVGRNEDFTPYYDESDISSLQNLSVKKREAIVLLIDFVSPITEKKLVNEIPFYADSYAKTFSGSTSYTIDVPKPDEIQYAILRVSVGRASASNHNINIKLNGTTLDVKNENCFDRLDDGKEYGSLKIVKVDTSLLQASNTIEISFADGKTSGIGSVVLRAAYYGEDNVESMSLDREELDIYKGESKGIGVEVIPQTAGNKSVLWESMDESVARVDADGLITGVDVGSTKIIAITEDGGFKDTCTVNVSELTLHSFVDKSGWIAIAADSEGKVTPMPMQNAVDDNVNTYWHTEWQDGKDPLPHFIVVDMQKEFSLSTFYYLPRQDQYGPNGVVGDFELYISNDTSNWGTAAYAGSMDWPENPTKEDYLALQVINLNTIYTGRYFKFVGLTEHQNNPDIPFTAVAEFYASEKGTGISIPDTVNIEVGQSVSISATIPPQNSPMDPSMLSWTSEDESIAMVLNGEISTISTGSTTVICYTSGKVYADTCVVNVLPVKVNSVELSKKNYTLYVGNYRTLTATLKPDNASNKTFFWSSTEPGIVSVDENGKIVALALGDAKIVATSEDGGYTDTCEVSVIPISVTSIALSREKQTLYVGTATTLSAVVNPRDADDKSFTWKSTHPDIASVNKGLVKGIKHGMAEIIVETTDGRFTDTCKVTVIDLHLYVEDITSQKISIYPNPVTDGKIYLKGMQINECTFTVIDISGKQVLNGITIEDEIEIRELKRGFYFIQIKSGKFSQSFKISVK